MSKKIFWLIFGLLILIFFLAPGKMFFKKMNAEPTALCLLPLDGNYQYCIGFRANEVCQKQKIDMCYQNCEQTCYGIVRSMVDRNFLNIKINYWK